MLIEVTGVSLHRSEGWPISSNGAPWARPGAMPRGPKWGGANFAPPKKRAQGQLPIFDFLT